MASGRNTPDVNHLRRGDEVEVLKPEEIVRRLREVIRLRHYARSTEKAYSRNIFGESGATSYTSNTTKTSDGSAARRTNSVTRLVLPIFREPITATQAGAPCCSRATASSSHASSDWRL